MSEPNKEAPHQAVIYLKTEMMESLPSDEVTGIPVAKWKRLFTLRGDNYDDCEAKVNEFIRRINELLK